MADTTLEVGGRGTLPAQKAGGSHPFAVCGVCEARLGLLADRAARGVRVRSSGPPGARLLGVPTTEFGRPPLRRNQRAGESGRPQAFRQPIGGEVLVGVARSTQRREVRVGVVAAVPPRDEMMHDEAIRGRAEYAVLTISRDDASPNDQPRRRIHASALRSGVDAAALAGALRRTRDAVFFRACRERDAADDALDLLELVRSKRDACTAQTAVLAPRGEAAPDGERFAAPRARLRHVPARVVAGARAKPLRRVGRRAVREGDAAAVARSAVSSCHTDNLVPGTDTGHVGGVRHE